MKVIHILHHSVSPFKEQFPDKDAMHYNSGFPMQFARETRKRYPDAEIECWRPEHTLRTEYRWCDETHHIKHRVFPSVFLRYGWELSFPMLRAAKEYAQTGKWCFFVHGSYNLHAYCLAGMLAGAPAILQSHGGLPALARMRLSLRPWLRPLLLPLALVERLTLPRYSHIFAVNMQEKHEIKKMLPSISVSFSPVGIDFEIFSPGDKQTSRKRLDLNPTAQIALYVGRLAPEKGIEYLLEATVALIKKFPHFKLYLVGTGPSESTLRQKVNELDIQRYAHFVGYTDHSVLVDWYRAADVACLPSLFEGFGMTVAEAMACGTPAVMAQSAGTESVVQAFECGVLVPPRNPIELCTAIARVLQESVDTQPNIAHAKSLLDWSAKLQYSFDILQTRSLV